MIGWCPRVSVILTLALTWVHFCIISAPSIANAILMDSLWANSYRPHALRRSVQEFAKFRKETSPYFVCLHSYPISLIASASNNFLVLDTAEADGNKPSLFSSITL